ITNSATGVAISITRTQIVDNQMNGVLANSVVDSTIARNAGTGVYVTQSEIAGSTINDNLGGGVQGSQVHVKDSTIQRNIAAGGGAAVNATSSIVVENSLIADNEIDLT